MPTTDKPTHSPFHEAWSDHIGLEPDDDRHLTRSPRQMPPDETGKP